MLNRDNLRDFIPEDGTYKGVARISFRAPDGEVTGPGTIRVSPDGHVVVRVDVEQYSIPREYREFLMGFLQGDLPEPTGTGGTIFRIGGTHRTGTLEVKVSEHCFRSDRALVSRTHGNFFTNENAWFEVVPFGLELSVDAAHSEAIWCMPLFGSLSEFERCANACFVNEQTPYIHFDSDGHACGVLVFPPMDESSDREFSAVIFGEIGGRAHGTLDEISNLLPWGVFAALDFASGSDVRAPWLELRGHDGKLKRRVHLRFGGDIAEEGFPTFSRFDSANPGSGIAEFLRCFFRLPPQQRRSLTPRMTLVRRGAPGSATIDESITNLIKALDATCKRHGFGRESLAGKLDGLNSKAVDQVITEAREKLRILRRQSKDAGKLDQLAVLDKIISRQANVAGDELDFGIAVAGLLRMFGLNDGVVMEGYYSKLTIDNTWEGLLSSIRGEVIHSGAIRVNGRAEVVSWFEFARHLHDICKRVILREIGYTGTYAASNVLHSGTYDLDRITPLTTTAQLGYTIPPTM